MSEAARTPIVVTTSSDAIRRGVTAMVDDLRDALAAGEALLADHVDAYDEVIPHVFTSELGDHVLEMRDAASVERDLTAISWAFERALAASAAADEPAWRDYLVNLLYVSWFECIEERPTVLGAFLAVSEPLVLEQYAAYVRDTELYWRIHGVASGPGPN